jgi:hypothetical protein
MTYLGLTDAQYTLVLLASIPVLARGVVMAVYRGPNPLQENLFLILLFVFLSVMSIYVYYRITA